MRSFGVRAAMVIVAGLMGLVGVGGGVATAAGATGGASAGSTPGTTSPAPTTSTPQAGAGPFAGTGMWIWELGRSSGGSAQAIAAKARAYHVHTVFLKSSDGSSAWRQFTPGLVSTLKRRGLRVCAWQYVYGNHPETEAALGARAAALGADCLVIDAESEYEGRYASAQRYITALRHRVGRRYPLALAGFPYVDYHPAFPYSVFLGPGGAQWNAPQMYWRDIGVSVDRVFTHTYRSNTVYGRGILPLGQLYNGPGSAEIRRFRLLARAFGAPGLSWWDWQEALPYAWRALGQSLAGQSATRPAFSTPPLAVGARGDVVVWAQQHLRGAGVSTAVDGIYGRGTRGAVAAFQRARRLTPTGRIESRTWRALLRYPAAPVGWTGKRAKTGAATATAPRSASLPPVRDEIRPKRHGR